MKLIFTRINSLEQEFTLVSVPSPHSSIHKSENNDHDMATVEISSSQPEGAVGGGEAEASLG